MRNKNQEGNGNGTGHIKFRVIEFEVNGANDTLTEGIKALTNALSKGSGTSSVTPRTLPPAAKRTAVVAEPTDLDGTEGRESDEETAELLEDETVETASHIARPKRPASPPPTPIVLSDIDLNAGKISLKAYVAQKAPSGPNQIYATIAVWYKENHNLDEVNADRIYTAYRFLEQVPPNNVAQVLRRLKFDRWFDKGSVKGGYKINIVGINKVHANFK
jgi:hypothetical protein